MEVKSASAESVFQVFTAADSDTKVFLLDVRPLKDFKKKHILQAYSVRLAANGRALLVRGWDADVLTSLALADQQAVAIFCYARMLVSHSPSRLGTRSANSPFLPCTWQDYSKNEYHQPWSKDCW